MSVDNKKDEIIKMFTQIWGVGLSKAERVYDIGCRTVEDLRDRVKTDPDLLSDNQHVGLKYYEILQERIPREDIIIFEEQIRELFNEFGGDSCSLKFKICGSYRRLVETSGDIDCLITIDTDNNDIPLDQWNTMSTINNNSNRSQSIRSESNNSSKKISKPLLANSDKEDPYLEYQKSQQQSGMTGINYNRSGDFLLPSLIQFLQDKKVLLETLTVGAYKYMGIGLIKGIPRRIDFYKVEPEHWAASTLYFTGNRRLNIEMRKLAQKKGLKLNEKGLYNEKLEVYLETETEEEIFEALGLNYIPPWKRSRKYYMM